MTEFYVLFYPPNYYAIRNAGKMTPESAKTDCYGPALDRFEDWSKFRYNLIAISKAPSELINKIPTGLIYGLFKND